MHNLTYTTSGSCLATLLVGQEKLPHATSYISSLQHPSANKEGTGAAERTAALLADGPGQPAPHTERRCSLTAGRIMTCFRMLATLTARHQQPEAWCSCSTPE
jgi:hypothetical protein